MITFLATLMILFNSGESCEQKATSKVISVLQQGGKANKVRLKDGTVGWFRKATLGKHITYCKKR